MDVPADAIRETWENMYDMSVELAGIIEQHCRYTGERFDAMLVVPRGGYYPANIVSRELGFSAPHLLHACVGSYQAASRQRAGGFALGQMPTREQLAGKNILIVEEVCDTGQTLDFLYKFLKENGAQLVRTGVLYHKPGQSQTGFQPDWAVKSTEDWIVYPWEDPHEDIGQHSVVRKK